MTTPVSNVTDDKLGSSDVLVELADMSLHVARKLSAYPLQNPDITPLSPLERLVLLHVHRRPGVSPSNIAQELALSSSNAATALRGLIRKGQLQRDPDPSDRRAACLHLTPAAERAIVFVHRTWTQLLGQARLCDADVRTAVHVLTAIDATLAEP